MTALHGAESFSWSGAESRGDVSSFDPHDGPKSGRRRRGPVVPHQNVEIPVAVVTGGRVSVERGPHIFVTHEKPGLRLRRVAEVVFRDRLALPLATRWREPGGTEWQPLFDEG